MFPLAAQLEAWSSNWQELSQQVPVWGDVLIGLIGAYGILLWLFGRRLVRPTFTVAGMVAGLVVVAVILRQQLSQLNVIPWLVLAAVGGGLVAWVLYRLWMAILLAAALAIAAPWSVAVWQATPPPNVADQLAKQGQAFVEQNVPNLGDLIELPAGDADNDGTSSEASSSDTLADQIAEAIEQIIDQWRQWWADLGKGGQWTFASVGLGGVAVGLAVGLITPNFAAALLTSMLGAMLAIGAILRLGSVYLPKAMEAVPTEGRWLWVVAAAAVVVGVTVQWIFHLRSADK